jgi:hypothetical protein
MTGEMRRSNVQGRVGPTGLGGLWGELPGPPLVGLASPQAIKLRAFSPQTGLLRRAESPNCDSPG